MDNSLHLAHFAQGRISPIAPSVGPAMYPCACSRIDTTDSGWHSTAVVVDTVWCAMDDSIESRTPPRPPPRGPIASSKIRSAMSGWRAKTRRNCSASSTIASSSGSPLPKTPPSSRCRWRAVIRCGRSMANSLRASTRAGCRECRYRAPQPRCAGVRGDSARRRVPVVCFRPGYWTRAPRCHAPGG